MLKLGFFLFIEVLNSKLWMSATQQREQIKLFNEDTIALLLTGIPYITVPTAFGQSSQNYPVLTERLGQTSTCGYLKICFF
jgi:hypothetical protein